MVTEVTIYCYSPDEMRRVGELAQAFKDERAAAALERRERRERDARARVSLPAQGSGGVTAVPAEPGIMFFGNNAPADTPATPKPVTLEDAIAAYRVFANGKSLPEVAAVFTTFGIKRVSELKPEQYAAFVEALR